MSCSGIITSNYLGYWTISFKCSGFVAHDINVKDRDQEGEDFVITIQENGQVTAYIGISMPALSIDYQYGVSNASLSENLTLRFTYSQLNYQIGFYFPENNQEGGPSRATVSKGSGFMGIPLNNPNHPLNNPNHPLNNPNHPLNLERHQNSPVESFKNMCAWDFWNWLWFLIIVLVVIYLIYYFVYKKKTINFDL